MNVIERRGGGVTALAHERLDDDLGAINALDVTIQGP